MENIRYKIKMQMPIELRGEWIVHPTNYRCKARALKDIKKNKGTQCILVTLRKSPYGYGYEVIEREDY